MVKKLLTLAIGLFAASFLMAQSAPKSVTINESDIQFWVGNGSNSSVVAIGWDDNTASYTPTVVVWGIHWNGTITLLNALDTIMAYDSRFSYILSGSFVNDLSYIDPAAGVQLTPSAHFNCNSYNGVYGFTNLTSTWLRISESTCENYNFTGVNNLIYASNPNTTTADATIAASDILYWIGSGSDSAIFAISNGVNTRAWGYLFDEDDEPTALEMSMDISEADPRLVYTIVDWVDYSLGFSYKEGSTIISIPDSIFKVDGVLADAGDNLFDYDLHNGSVVVVSTETGSTWTTPIVPATVMQMPVNSTIDTSEILYWVGSGSNEAVVVVNWGVPDTALAWGLRFSEPVTIGGAIDAIAAADPRVTTDAAHSTINYSDGNVSLSFQPAPDSYMQFILNDNSNVNSTTELSDGDQLKIGESAYGVGYDSIDYMGMWYPMGVVWNTTIHPVSVPGSDPEPVVEATIAFSDILYWVGTGSNEAVMAVNWADTALAWGYRWNDSATVGTMMAAIAAADPRFSYDATGWLNDIYFNDGTVSLAITPGNYWGSTNNGVVDMGMDQPLSNGDFEKWGDPAAGVIVDSNNYGGPIYYYTYAYPMTVHPVSVPESGPVDATIAAEDIRYWVGEGDNEIIFVVNWASKAYAWGYRFATDSVNLAVVMDDIAAADSRFAYTASGLVDDITYNDGTENLSITPGNYWSHLLNGESSMGLYSYLHDGDFSRWADPAAGIVVDSVYIPEWNWTDYIYAYPMPITPVEVPYVPGPFCGIVGSEGCNAIAADSSIITAWATACTVERGPWNISVQGSPAVSYGTENDAVGPCTINNNLSVVSLGDGGSATLTFAEPIADGEGPDFAVFENSFDDYFLELAFVEVSSDGQRFVRFPATSLTQTNTQIVNHVDPTYINNLAGKFRMGYGTPFDLSELSDSTGLDISAITHVRIVDVVGSINPLYATYDAFGHIVNDPWPTDSYSTGFDLDGVAVLSHTANAVDEVDADGLSIYPNPVVDLLNIQSPRAAVATLYDLCGRRLADYSLSEGRNTINLGHLSSGIYILRADGSAYRVVKH